MAVMIVGGDSRLAREAAPLFVEYFGKVYVTTRRTKRPSVFGEEVLFLDLGDVDSFRIPDDVDAMAIVGGVVDYGECTKQYDYAYQVNCVNIPKLAGRLLQRGGYVCFVSTNTVFKSEHGVPAERDVRCPGFAYAELKAKAEEKLEEAVAALGCEKRFSILRLTKNVGPETSPFGQWVDDLAAGKTLTPFDDLYFAPVRFEDSARALLTVMDHRKGGIFHLSGERDVNYKEFAKGLCEFLNLPADRVSGLKSTDVGVKLLYNHPITALAMPYTQEKLGLEPVPLCAVYSLLGELYRERKQTSER
jgi:dTDP-4-dehydrorhamnose reductase